MPSNTLLNGKLVKEEIKKEIKFFLDFNKNESTPYTKLWHTMKVLLRRHVALSICDSYKNIWRLEDTHSLMSFHSHCAVGPSLRGGE